ncbi:hypothetical protein PAMP_002234 [Pampus punctatissimus]
MLFTFSRFQLICLNMPSSSPKKPPPLLTSTTRLGRSRRREGYCYPTLFSISMKRSICRRSGASSVRRRLTVAVLHTVQYDQGK